MLAARLSAHSMICGRAFPSIAAVGSLIHRSGYPWQALHVRPTVLPCSTPMLGIQLVREIRSVMRPQSRNETEAKILTSRMKQAESATNFLFVLEEAVDSKVFNDFHASVAYHSLATWKRRGELEASDKQNPAYPSCMGNFRQCYFMVK